MTAPDGADGAQAQTGDRNAHTGTQPTNRQTMCVTAKVGQGHTIHWPTKTITGYRVTLTVTLTGPPEPTEFPAVEPITVTLPEGWTIE